jgi:hypothetical protein
MTTAILAGVIRGILPAAAVALNKYGIDISGFDSPEASLALATVVTVVWSIVAKVKKKEESR